MSLAEKTKDKPVGCGPSLVSLINEVRARAAQPHLNTRNTTRGNEILKARRQGETGRSSRQPSSSTGDKLDRGGRRPTRTSGDISNKLSTFQSGNNNKF